MATPGKRMASRAQAQQNCIDPHASGRQLGALQCPGAEQNAIVSTHVVPYAQIANGQGPTVAIIAHARANSLDAALIVGELMRGLDTPAINGRVRLVSGFRASEDIGTRLSMHKALVEQVVDGADLVVEIGGDTPDWEWCGTAATRSLNKSRGEASHSLAENARLSFGAPMSLRMTEDERNHATPDICLGDDRPLTPAGMMRHDTGTLADACRLRDIAHMQVFTGSDQAEFSRRDMLRIGCRNILISNDVLDQALTLRASRLFRCSPLDDSMTTPVAGALHMTAMPGRNIYRGDVLAYIVDPAEPWREPTRVCATKNAVVMAARRGSIVAPGDAIALLADEIQG